MRKQGNKENGSVLLGVLILVSLALIITAGMLDSASTNSKTRALVNTQSDYFYSVEETLNDVVAWLQTNSKNLVKGFTEGEFEGNFDLGSPTLGDNEGEHFGVPTLVKMAGTNNSVMVSNNTFFGQSAFPTTENIDTGAMFDPAASFNSADLGEANARIIMTWARETDGNYEPIFRVDVVTGNNPDRGVHAYSYVYSHLVVSGNAYGFYGRDYVSLESPNNDCYSYKYAHNGTNWRRGGPRANCPVASDGPVNISSDVNGTAKTKLDDGVALLPPGGNVSGETCTGADCHDYSLPIFQDWASYCNVHNGDLAVSADMELPAGGCWQDVAIANKTTLTLSDTENPYYFRTLNFGPNSAIFSIGEVDVGKQVIIYVETISNNSMNGNQFYNQANAPHQMVINYIGHENLTLNGTADINAFLVAPNVNVRVNGNFNYYGGIQAASIDVLGSARINFDEGQIPAPQVTDINFSLKKTSQRYR